MRIGPDGFNKIAVMGTAGSSMELTPFKDESWSIWACSPGAYPTVAKNRCNAWFEVHRWQPSAPGQIGAPGTKPWFTAEYHAFMQQMKGPVFMSERDESIPNSVAIQFDQLIEKYGPYFWTSTLAYMLAMAIDALQERAAAGEKVAIGLFGVDMAASEEWAYQRPGCQHFIGLAMSLGIDVVLPPESDLMRPPTMYGIGELNPRHIRYMAKRAEVAARLASLTQQQQGVTQELIRTQGMLGEIDYTLAAWTDDVKPDLRKAVSFSGEFAKPLGALSKALAEAQGPDSTGASVVPMQEAKTG